MQKHIDKLLKTIKGDNMPKHDRSSQCEKIEFVEVKSTKDTVFGVAIATDVKGGQVILAPTSIDYKPRFYREFLQTLDEFQNYMKANNLNIAYSRCLSYRLWELAQSQAKQKAIR